ncbi:glycosyltransferase family 9 protein [Candidatus Latescibacterota bacterium]
MNGGIGNAAEATPLVQAIRALWPKSEITIFPPSGDLLDDWCVVNNVARSAEDLNDESFTHTFLTYYSEINTCGTSCNFGKVYRIERLLGPEFLKPEREYNLDMLRRLGYKGPTPPLYVSLREPKEITLSGGLRICLVPGSKPQHRWRNKRWPYFKELTETLLRDYSNAHVFIIGTKEDHVPASLFCSSRVVDLRGQLTLREVAWTMRQSHLVIGNDCGPMHIADAVQTLSIWIFGPSCVLKNDPLYKSVVVAKGLKCSPCQYNRQLENCENPVCITDLNPDIVLKHVSTLFNYVSS